MRIHSFVTLVVTSTTIGFASQIICSPQPQPNAENCVPQVQPDHSPLRDEKCLTKRSKDKDDDDDDDEIYEYNIESNSTSRRADGNDDHNYEYNIESNSTSTRTDGDDDEHYEYNIGSNSTSKGSNNDGETYEYNIESNSTSKRDEDSDDSYEYNIESNETNETKSDDDDDAYEYNIGKKSMRSLLMAKRKKKDKGKHKLKVDKSKRKQKQRMKPLLLRKYGKLQGVFRSLVVKMARGDEDVTTDDQGTFKKSLQIFFPRKWERSEDKFDSMYDKPHMENIRKRRPHFRDNDDDDRPQQRARYEKVKKHMMKYSNKSLDSMYELAFKAPLGGVPLKRLPDEEVLTNASVRPKPYNPFPKRPFEVFNTNDQSVIPFEYVAVKRNFTYVFRTRKALFDIYKHFRHLPNRIVNGSWDNVRRFNYTFAMRGMEAVTLHPRIIDRMRSGLPIKNFTMGNVTFPTRSFYRPLKGEAIDEEYDDPRQPYRPFPPPPPLPPFPPMPPFPPRPRFGEPFRPLPFRPPPFPGRFHPDRMRYPPPPPPPPPPPFFRRPFGVPRDLPEDAGRFRRPPFPPIPPRWNTTRVPVRDWGRIGEERQNIFGEFQPQRPSLLGYPTQEPRAFVTRMTLPPRPSTTIKISFQDYQEFGMRKFELNNDDDYDDSYDTIQKPLGNRFGGGAFERPGLSWNQRKQSFLRPNMMNKQFYATRIPDLINLGRRTEIRPVVRTLIPMPLFTIRRYNTFIRNNTTKETFYSTAHTQGSTLKTESDKITPLSTTYSTQRNIQPTSFSNILHERSTPLTQSVPPVSTTYYYSTQRNIQPTAVSNILQERSTIQTPKAPQRDNVSLKEKIVPETKLESETEYKIQKTRKRFTKTTGKKIPNMTRRKSSRKTFTRKKGLTRQTRKREIKE